MIFFFLKGCFGSGSVLIWSGFGSGRRARDPGHTTTYTTSCIVFTSLKCNKLCKHMKSILLTFWKVASRHKLLYDYSKLVKVKFLKNPVLYCSNEIYVNTLYIDSSEDISRTCKVFKNKFWNAYNSYPV
jgi:hypothetical protein